MADDFEVVGKIVVDQSGAVSIQGINSELDRMNGGVGGLSSGMSALGSVANLVWGGIILGGINLVFEGIKNVIGAVSDFAKSTVSSAAESQEAVTMLEATLRSTGYAAGMSSQELQSMATALQGVTKFSDETILRGQGMLLTFTQIGKDIFPQATQAMLDLAAKMGTDVQGAAIQLGKALNDPITGVTALRRVGVMLTDQQQEAIKVMVESGDLMGAQKIILNELSTEFGNTAQAAGTTFAGQIVIANNKLDDFKELIGGAVLPVLGQLRVSFVGLLDAPAMVAIKEFFLDWNTYLGMNLPYLEALSQSLFNLGIPFHDLAYAVLKLSDNLKAGENPLDAILDFVIQIGDTNALAGLVDTFDTFVAGIIDGITTSVEDWLAGDGPERLSDKLVEWIENIGTSPVVPSKATLAATHLMNALVDAIGAIEWGEIAVAIDNKASQAVADTDWSQMSSTFTQAVLDFPQYLVNALLDTDWGGMVDTVTPFIIDFLEALGWAIYSTIKGIGDGITDWVTDLNWETFGTAIGDDIRNGMFTALNGLVQILLPPFINFINKIKEIFGVASPSTVFRDIGINLILGLMSGWTTMFTVFYNLANASIGSILALFAPILELFGVDTGIGVGVSGTGTGLTGSGTATLGGGGSGVVNNYYYGPVYFGAAGEPGAYYDCPSPNPILAGTYPSATASTGSLQ